MADVQGHTAEEQAVEAPPLSWPLKFTLLLVSSLTIMSVITISPALPQMTLVFAGVPHAAFLVKLVLTIPALFIALVAPLTGRLIDKHGRLPLLKLALLLYAVAGVVPFFLSNLYLILFSRALLGVAVGMSMTIVITLIADYFEGAQRQRFVGLQVAFMSLGGIVFLALAGTLADKGWRYPFLLYSFSLLVLPCTLLYLREPVVTPAPLHKQVAHRSPRLIWMLFFNTMLMWILFFLIPVHLPFLLQALNIEKNALVGAAIATATATSAVSSFGYAALKKRLHFLSVFALGYFLMAAGFALTALGGAYAAVVVGMLLAGLGVGMMIPNTNMWVMKIAPPEIRGQEIGKLTTFWFLGQFLSPIAAQPVVQALPLATAFLLVAGVMLLLSAGFALWKWRIG